MNFASWTLTIFLQIAITLYACYKKESHNKFYYRKNFIYKLLYVSFTKYINMKFLLNIVVNYM